MKRILCYGDSNTWGYRPDGQGRFDVPKTWPGVMAAALEGQAVVDIDGLCGRTTTIPDPVEGEHLNGAMYLLPCLLAHSPLDLVIIKLGCNDQKRRFNMHAIDIAAALAIAYFLQKNELEKTEQQNDLDGSAELTATEQNQIGVRDITDNSKISLLLGYKLVEMVQDEKTSKLLSRITTVRKEISRALGFVMPGVRVRDELDLAPNSYQIKLGQTIAAEDIIYPTHKLAIPGDNSKTKLTGIEVSDPTFGVDAIWIEEAIVPQAQADDYVVIEPDAVLATHLSQVLKKHAYEILSQDDVQALLDNLTETSPSLVESTVPKLVPINTLTAVLRNLLSERVPISDLRKILEKLSSINIQNVAPMDLAELLRPSLSRLILQQFLGVSEQLPIMLFAPELEKILMQAVQQHGSDNLIIDGELAKSIQVDINKESEKLSARGRPAILVVAPQIRRSVSMFFRPSMPDLVVLSFSELPDDRNIDVVSTIGRQEVLEQV